MTPQQRAIEEKASELLRLLDANVPLSTIHWAVEGSRRSLRVLLQAHRTYPIVTRDAPATASGDARG